jgi:hypothetical protein
MSARPCRVGFIDATRRLVGDIATMTGQSKTLLVNAVVFVLF